MILYMARRTLEISLSLWTLKQSSSRFIWQTAVEVFDKQWLVLRWGEPHLRTGERILGANGDPKWAASKVSETSVPPNTWYQVLPRPWMSLEGYSSQSLLSKAQVMNNLTSALWNPEQRNQHANLDFLPTKWQDNKFILFEATATSVAIFLTAREN